MWFSHWTAHARFYGGRAWAVLVRAFRHVTICAVGGHRPKMDLDYRCVNCGRRQ